MAPIEPKGGTNLDLTVRNNWPAIRTFHLEAAGEGLEFFPAKTEIAVGAMDERRVPLRVFAAEGRRSDRPARLAPARRPARRDLEMPMRVVLLPRGRTVAWSADLDGDGSPEWVLESPRARAVFSAQDGGRWMEFTWKDTNLNFLPEQGAFAAAGRWRFMPRAMRWNSTAKVGSGPSGSRKRRVTIEPDPRLTARRTGTRQARAPWN